MPLFLRTLSLALFSVIIVGCADTYQPLTEINARIRVKGDRKGAFHWNQLSLMGIDQKPTGMPLYDGQFYTVDAGKHSFIVRYVGNRRLGGPFLEAPPIPVLGDLKAEQDYEIRGQFSEISVALQVKEVATGKAAGPTTVAPLHYQNPSSGFTPVFIPIPASR